MTKALHIMVLFVINTGIVHAGEWNVDKKHPSNKVQFISEVVSLKFDGTSRNIDGYVYWEGEGPISKGSQFLFVVDMSTFDTGIGKRDHDMRIVLNTREWPQANFKGTIADIMPDTSAANTYNAIAQGVFSLHGIEKSVGIPATITVGDSTAYIDADFTIKLQDYKIEAPSLAAFIKVSQEVLISVQVHMKHILQEKK